ncbi:glycosyl hydrolase [Actinoplanes sp. NEAU-A12]|uniref:Glycosyl hydrolase n=1 Tax=Actinoplanes sandaracinus TaxID=3045177 RepID=A0ABT6WXE9_9ACTN|nr:glycosyl hydrolase [Actinoplanes sandaracinus]MDI6104416.1 glycosyl hydrolase [Actinoplanes sandaracinus]
MGVVVKRRQLLTLLTLTGAAGCGDQTSPAVPSGSAPSPEVTARTGSALTITSPPPSPSVTPSAARDARDARDDRVMLGSYLALGGRTLKQSLALRRDQLGREQRIVHRFYPWNGYVPTAEPDVADSSLLMVSWHGAPWAGILDGGSDRHIRSVARKLKGMGRPILLRWGWEMNGDWFEWSGARNGRNPADYVTAWKRLRGVFADQGADNVSWVWSPNWNSAPAAGWNRVQRYYPGDDQVDWVGISGYNFYGESPATLFNPVTKLYGGRKPIILSETAAVRDKAKWIRQLQSWVEDTPAVGAVVWFDTDIQEGTDNNFRFDTDAAALAAYRTMARGSRFAG